MDSVLGWVVGFGILIAASLTIAFAGTRGFATTSESWKAAVQQSELRLESDIAVTSVASNGFEWDVLVENRGRTAVEDFARLDLIAHYTDATGDQVRWLPFAGALQPNTWTAAILGDAIGKGVLNEDEILQMTVCIDPPVEDTTLNWLQVTTERGISAARVFAGAPVLGDCSACPAGDTGWMNATSQAATTGGSGNGFEENPTGAFADGGGFASNVRSPGDRHLYYDYGVDLSSLCIITGIEVRLDWWLALLVGTNSMSVELSWDGGASWTAAKTDTTQTSTEHSFALGGPSDTWGRAWSPNEFIDQNFRARVTGNCTGSPVCLVQDFSLDWIPVRVYVVPSS
jgi:hypothetical protein